ncbi:MAG: sugar ABC transporter permease [Ruminococcaceae bacterium]|nr:sugar ABC transporter permease [Oscillospiraceae bacterium]
MKGQEISLRKRIAKSKVSYLMLLPFSLFFFLFMLFPIIISVILSFTSYDYFNTPVFVGLDNFASLLLSDNEFITAIQNTLLFAVITGPLSYVLCFFIAWLINDLSKGLRSFITFVFYAPSISGQLYVVWQIILSSDQYGIVNGLLMKYGIINEPMLFLKDPEMILGILILVQLWLSLGTGFLAFVAGFQMINPDLYEAGAIDGIHNRWQELWYVTLPQMKPMLLFGAITQITTSFSAGDISLQLCGYPSINNAGLTVTLHAYDYANIRYEMGYACAITLLLFVFMYLIHKIIDTGINRIGR